MPPTTKKQQQTNRDNRATKPTNPVAERRAQTRKQREEARQRLVLQVTGVAIGLALLVALAGAIYQFVWLPNQTVAQVNSTILSRNGYWEERRLALARDVVQNLQLIEMFAGQDFADQFRSQPAIANQQVLTLKSADLDQATLSNWRDTQLTEQGAMAMNIMVNDDEVAQLIVQRLNEFLPPPMLDLSATATPEATAEPTAEPTSAPVADGEPTATATTAPTATPEPTPSIAEAQADFPRIMTEIYSRFREIVVLYSQEPALTQEDFEKALKAQYRKELLQTRIKEQLVPEASFTPSTEPTSLSASQILLKVDVPEGASDDEKEKLFADRLAEAQRIVQELKSGADFAELAEQYSEDEGSKENGGALGSFSPDGVNENGAHYAPEFVAAARELEVDQISDPVRTQFGWHIIKLTNRVVPSAEEQLSSARTKAFDEWMAQQRSQATIKIENEPTATIVVPTTPPAPTTPPTFVPGPPTAIPTVTPDPSLEEELEIEVEPTATPES
jgi:Parvulin-like peptidyl-prolyl isomerase